MAASSSMRGQREIAGRRGRQPQKIAFRRDAEPVEQAVGIVEIGADLVRLKDLAVVGAGGADRDDVSLDDELRRLGELAHVAQQRQLLAVESKLRLARRQR